MERKAKSTPKRSLVIDALLRIMGEYDRQTADDTDLDSFDAIVDESVSS
jgi:hypothetical protein